MMDTILNLGINDEIVEGLGAMMGDRRPAWDAYRRFIQIYAEVVQEVAPEPFEECLAEHKARAGSGAGLRTDSSEQLQAVTRDFKEIARESAGAAPPDDPWKQLLGAVEAVFRSWHNPRAIVYRNQYGIDHDMGTAVTIMGMVYGNLGPTSGTGVLFTRDPSTGKREVYGEFLTNAQGEDVVAGVRTPEPLSALAEGYAGTVGGVAGAGLQSGEALPRCPGRGVHHRTRPPLPSADAQREAHAAIGGEDGGGHGTGGYDRPGAGAQSR